MFVSSDYNSYDYNSYDYGSGYESGYELTNEKDNKATGFIIIFIIISPFIIIFSVLLLRLSCCIIADIREEIIEKKKKYMIKKKEKKYIKDGKLTTNYINELNKRNPINEISDNCSICLEKITKNHKYVTLNCSHTFHKKCLQLWIKKQTSEYNNPTCPLDRVVIIEIPKVNHQQVTYSSDSDNSDFD